MLLFFFAMVTATVPSWAEYGKDEPLLYLTGSPTADTLRQGEITFGPPWGGWIAVGLNEHVTFGWDYPASLFAGVPAFLLRASPFDNASAFKISFEVYGNNWGSSWQDKRSDHFLLEHRGTSGWAHLLLAWRFAERFRFHLYGGANYAQYQSYSQNKGSTFATSVFENAITPNYGATLQWDMNSWLKLSVNAMSGNSFYYVDQVTRKNMIVYSFDMAPFSKNAIGILRTFRLELSAMWLWMPVAGNYYTSVGVPIFPAMYWQFML